MEPQSFWNSVSGASIASGRRKSAIVGNLVASQTREGEVYRRLLEKLEEERNALGGKVFDILGKLVFDGKQLRDLLKEAIRYGDSPEARERFNAIVNNALDRNKLRDLIEEHALAHDSMDASRVFAIRDDMERAEARRLQPHFIASFFKESFKTLVERCVSESPNALRPRTFLLSSATEIGLSAHAPRTLPL